MATKSNKNGVYGIYPRVRGKKRKFAEELANPEFDGTISELCLKHDVARSTYYRWCEEDAEFIGYVNYLIDKYTDSELANVWRAVISKAKCGSVEAQRLYFELKGKYKQKVVITVDDEVIKEVEEMVHGDS